MPRRALAITGLFLAMIVGVSAYAHAANMLIERDIGESEHIAPPRLIVPSTDVVDLRGRDCLEFKWSPHEGDQVMREYYDFRLYKGSQAYGQARIYITRVPPRQWSICVDTSIFENGATYTLALRQVYRGLKSKRTFQTFKVFK